LKLRSGGEKFLSSFCEFFIKVLLSSRLGFWNFGTFEAKLNGKLSARVKHREKKNQFEIMLISDREKEKSFSFGTRVIASLLT
jgi:hypothetical protein